MSHDPEATRASSQKTRELLRIAPAFFGYLRADGEVIDSTELYLQGIKVSRADVIDHVFCEAPWWKSLPAAMDRVRTAVDAALHGEPSQFDIEYAALTPGSTSGEVRWLALTVAPVTDDTTNGNGDGGGKRVAATGIDITDHVRARMKLEESEARYRDAKEQLELALTSGQLGTWHIDLTTQRLTISATTAAMIGVSAIDDDVDDIARRVVHPDDLDRVMHHWKKKAAARTPYVDEFRIVRPGGEVHWVLSRGSTKVGVDGVTPYFSGVVHDITERKEQENALAAERFKLATIFRESPAAKALWRGPDLVFELVNPQFQAAFGNRVVLGLPLVVALPEFADQSFPRLLREVFESGETHSGREALARFAPTPGGAVEDHYWDFTFVCVNDPLGAPYGVYSHAVDVTDRVLARRELEASVRELEGERDLRERFVAALSHDLRTPLTTARLSAELLPQMAGDLQQLERAARRIVNSMARADAMIRDLLDASRIKAGEPIPLEIEPLELREVTRATLDDLASIYRDRLVLAPSSEIRGHWDRSAVRRIVENLATNAVKYGQVGTPITVRIEATATKVAIHVHNQGPPIPVDEQPKLFELFKRASSASKIANSGWGIGLSLVAGLARAHRGEASVRSNAEEGTTFSVRLPLDARPGR